MMHNDHALTKTGIDQAARLNALWKAASVEALKTGRDANKEGIFNEEAMMTLYIKHFLDATHVFSSPLTRAIQTALVVMEDHPALTKNPLTLMSCIREVKNVGGLDTVGIAIGEKIKIRVVEELAQEFSDQPERVKKLTKESIKFDFGDADEHWWTNQSTRDTSTEVDERIDEFLRHSRYCGAPIPVYVGHSLFFKDFYSKRVAKVLELNRPEMAKNMKHKLDNAVMMAVKVTYTGVKGEAQIVDAALMFGGNFHHESSFHDKDSSFVSPPSPISDSALIILPEKINANSI